MENQGKRLILAITLALGILLLWQVVFPPEKPQPKREAAPTDEVAQVERRLESPVGIPAGASERPAAAAAPAEELITLAFANVHVELSNLGGKIVSWRLTDPKWEGDWTRGEMVPDRGIGAFGVNFYRSPIVIPEGAAWEGTRVDERTVEYRYRSDELDVVKTFKLHPDDFLVEMAVAVQLLDGAPAPAGADPAPRREVTTQLAISFVGAQPPGVSTGGGMGQSTRDFRAACFLNGEKRTIAASQLLEQGPQEVSGTLRWAGFNHPYLFLAVAPRDAGRETIACNRYPVLPQDGGLQGGMRVDIVYQPAKLVAGAPAMRKEVAAFIGPKYVTALERADDVLGFSAGFAEAVDMGWFSFIARPLLSILQWLYSFVGNWGIAIILLTVIVKLATLYWTHKSMRSMKAMAALKPKMEELQKKYAGDKQKLQQEMMAMYKANGVNPLAGCLPMLLQMPIWLALYRMLSAVGELYLAPFIPGWIDDLTATDPYHVLPILLVGMMFLQSKLSPASLDSMQQKILVYGLPLMFGVMGFFFPSGLTLYILTNTTLSLFHTLYIKKTDKGAPAAAAAAKAAAKPAGGPREQARKRDDADAGKGATKGEHGASRKAREAELRDVEPADEPEAPEGDADDGEAEDSDGDAVVEQDRPRTDKAAAKPAGQGPRRGTPPRRKRKRKH